MKNKTLKSIKLLGRKIADLTDFLNSKVIPNYAPKVLIHFYLLIILLFLNAYDRLESQFAIINTNWLI